MADAKEKNPKLILKNLPVNGPGQKVTLDSAKPIASGKGEYGAWHLWVGVVDKTTVYEGNDNVAKNNYSGKVIFFAKDSLNEKLQQVAAGNKNVEVIINFKAERNKKGNLTQFYDVEKLSAGVIDTKAPNMTPTEAKMVEDVRKFKSQGYAVTEQSFIDSTQHGMYSEKISVERAKELFKLI